MSERFNLINENKILSFVNVRHPFDRLESAYYDKITGQGNTRSFLQITDSIKSQCKYETVGL